MGRKSYVIIILIGLIVCSYFTYKSYLFNLYIVNATEVKVKVDNVNCYVRSGKSGSRSEVCFRYLNKKYTSLISKEICSDLNIGDTTILFYAKEIDEFSYKSETNIKRLYISISFIVILLFFLLKVIFK